MNKAVIAALLSAFVCPGSGHFYLKRPNMGTLLSGISLSGLVYLLFKAVERAQAISDRILAGEIPLDFTLIYQQITQTPPGSDTLWINLATLAFIAAWVVGILDAYRIGRQADQEK
ncbi:hypothetical protein LZP69_11830 [Shewanella sp. AS1]|uniref:hypothetical protein n=1 Tax=Shewanella sp. AS1 TaxID=2907626 RepID=UPI001F1E1E24|nr:hypothetical protein [Shewanella sp. AS1]MCE9679852.1 hypothetical protein [Shewanella sp. AS1]